MNILLESMTNTFGFYSPEDKERFRKEITRYENYTGFIAAIRNGEEMQELSEEEAERIREIVEKQMEKLSDAPKEIDYEDVTIIQLS